MRHRARSILAASAFVFGTTLAALPAAAQAQPGQADRAAAAQGRVYDAHKTNKQVPPVQRAAPAAPDHSERAPETRA
ncbi:hypothetical protein ABZY57_17840, partial [Streptomyces sp. NPDC006450]|uniref:hypothetical protein n=1 Tax=Streptomyces sp. NPDC006450 TaxID=3155458 RepID=UPI0033A2C648